MTTDTRELLELAAKACGLALEWNDQGVPGYYVGYRGLPQWTPWNPITSDGDCAWMEAKLRISVWWSAEGQEVTAFASREGECEVCEQCRHDAEAPAARRMASTRVAAEIQRQREAS